MASSCSERRCVELCESPCGTATWKRLDVFFLVFDDLEGGVSNVEERRHQNPICRYTEAKAYLLSWLLNVVPTDRGVAWEGARAHLPCQLAVAIETPHHHFHPSYTSFLVCFTDCSPKTVLSHVGCLLYVDFRTGDRCPASCTLVNPPCLRGIITKAGTEPLNAFWYVADTFGYHMRHMQ
jgi:hypothetical protein